MEQKKLRIWTLFTQRQTQKNVLIRCQPKKKFDCPKPKRILTDFKKNLSQEKFDDSYEKPKLVISLKIY